MLLLDVIHEHAVGYAVMELVISVSSLLNNEATMPSQ